MRISVLRLFVALSVCITATTFRCNQVLPETLQTIKPFVTSCATDDENPAKDRATVDNEAMQFVETVLGSNPGAAYSTLTGDAKQNVTAEKLMAVVQQRILPNGPFKGLRVAHTYLAKVTGSKPQSVVCGNLSSMENWVTVAVKPGPQQAHVVVEGQTLNNTWAFVIWLLQEQGNWHVQYFQIAIATMVGKSAQDLRTMAQYEQQRHHTFNAYILYAAALELTDRGPNLQLGIHPQIQNEMAQLQVPRDLQGPPPFEWHFGKSSFKVVNVGPIGVGGRIYLTISHEVAPWADDRAADRENRDLIAAFANAYPEYLDAFAGLVIEARERGGARGFRTVDVKPESAK